MKRLCALFFMASMLCGANAHAGVDTIETLIEKANAGDVHAQWSLGTAYDWGRGVARDGAEATRWYRVAAEHGYAEAQNSLASVLEAEARTGKDALYVEAFQWYAKAAIQGNAIAINNLAQLYQTGRGVKPDYQKALELYTHSANLGEALAMANISVLYGAGLLGTKDMQMACVWTFRAERFTSPSDKRLQQRTAYRIEILKKSIAFEDYRTCKKDAAAWSPDMRTAELTIPIDAPVATP